MRWNQKVSKESYSSQFPIYMREHENTPDAYVGGIVLFGYEITTRLSTSPAASGASRST